MLLGMSIFWLSDSTKCTFTERCRLCSVTIQETPSHKLLKCNFEIH